MANYNKQYNYNYGRPADYDQERVHVREYQQDTVVQRPNYAKQTVVGCGVSMCCLCLAGLAAFIVVMILMSGISYRYHSNYYNNNG